MKNKKPESKILILCDLGAIWKFDVKINKIENEKFRYSFWDFSGTRLAIGVILLIWPYWRYVSGYNLTEVNSELYFLECGGPKMVKMAYQAKIQISPSQ